MARWILILLAAGALQARNSSPQQPPAQGQGELKTQRPAPARNDAIEAPPEEDKSLAVTTYSFNPLQSEKDVRVGNYYFNMRNYHAAAGRYCDGTQWEDGNSDAGVAILWGVVT